jgi:beta-glucosidase
MLNVRGVKDVRAFKKIAVEETRDSFNFGFDVIHGYKTISPIPLAESASWDMEAIKISSNGCRGGFCRWTKLDFASYG